MAIVNKLREREIGRLDIGGFITYGVDASVAEVLKKMRETRVSAVLVESAGKLAGIFTERDALIKVTDNPDTWCRPISALMTACPQTLTARQPISKALQLMNAGHYRNVPIVDDAGAIEGNLPQHEIIRFLTDEFPQDIYNLPPDPERIAHTKEGA